MGKGQRSDGKSTDTDPASDRAETLVNQVHKYRPVNGPTEVSGPPGSIFVDSRNRRGSYVRRPSKVYTSHTHHSARVHTTLIVGRRESTYFRVVAYEVSTRTVIEGD